LCTKSKDFAALPLPSNIATPTICRGKAFTIFAPNQKTSLPCPECRQRIPHPRSFGARHDHLCTRPKAMIAPTLKHRHTHDLSGQGTTISVPDQKTSLPCPYPQTSPHPRYVGARHDHLCTRPKAMIAPTLKHRHTDDM
ncbi:hypothetical protein, partial [Microseira wollei]|uniref:hypothetical protein n=1 Tax=Microseira wollei TaxID=467598 RepID=UPI001CFE2AEA